MTGFITVLGGSGAWANIRWTVVLGIGSPGAGASAQVQAAAAPRTHGSRGLAVPRYRTRPFRRISPPSTEERPGLDRGRVTDLTGDGLSPALSRRTRACGPCSAAARASRTAGTGRGKLRHARDSARPAGRDPAPDCARVASRRRKGGKAPPSKDAAWPGLPLAFGETRNTVKTTRLPGLRATWGRASARACRACQAGPGLASRERKARNRGKRWAVIQAVPQVFRPSECPPWEMKKQLSWETCATRGASCGCRPGGTHGGEERRDGCSTGRRQEAPSPRAADPPPRPPGAAAGVSAPTR